VVDLVLLGILAGMARAGWQSGFLRRLFGVGFIVVAFVGSAYLRAPVAALLTGFFPKVPDQYAATIGYSITFSAILLGLNLISGLLLARVATTGMARRTDQLLGVVLGIAEGVLLLSAAIVILHTYADPSSSLGGLSDIAVLGPLRDAIDGSAIGMLLSDTTVPIVLLVLGPFLPTDIKTIVPMAIPGGLPFFPTVPGVPIPTP
jgi:uncharacterized membrane protein required for colicin V production